MLTLDYSEKYLHVALNVKSKKARGRNKTSLHECIVFHPSEVFNEVNISGARMHREFFRDTEYKLACIKTEMGPGELAQMFAEKFGAHAEGWIGGMIASLTIPSEKLDVFWKGVTSKPNNFHKSREKKVFVSRRKDLPSVLIKT